MNENVTGQWQGARTPAPQTIPDRLRALPQDQPQIQVAAHAVLPAAVGPEDPHRQELRVAFPLLLGQRSTDPGGDDTGTGKGLLALQSAEVLAGCAFQVASGDVEAIEQPQTGEGLPPGLLPNARLRSLRAFSTAWCAAKQAHSWQPIDPPRPPVLPRAVPMAEAMVALALADHLLRQQGQCSLW